MTRYIYPNVISVFVEMTNLGSSPKDLDDMLYELENGK